MSYDNAEPKVLKTLNSSGQVLDDAGNTSFGVSYALYGDSMVFSYTVNS